MSIQPLCPQCRKLIAEQIEKPHDNLREFAHHEATTVDGGISEHEYHCNTCNHELRHISGLIMDSGWSELK